MSYLDADGYAYIGQPRESSLWMCFTRADNIPVQAAASSAACVRRRSEPRLDATT